MIFFKFPPNLSCELEVKMGGGGGAKRTTLEQPNKTKNDTLVSMF